MRFLRTLAILGLCGIGCIAWLDAAVGQGGIRGMILGLRILRDNAEPKKPTTPVDNLQELIRALIGCWNPPPVDKDRQPLDLTFTISFKRSGELFGKPRVVIFARAVTDQERQRYYQAVAEAVDLCSQMPFTDSMGGAVAGRTFQIRIIDMRNEKRASNPWLTTRTF